MKRFLKVVPLLVLLLASACSVDPTGLDSADSRSTVSGQPEVQLVVARAKVVTGNPHQGILSGDIELENIAYAKEVRIHYSVNGGQWLTATALYRQSLSNNRERWGFNIHLGSWFGMYDMRVGYSGPAWNVQFAVSYKVNGITYWDNNGGAGIDYRISTPGNGALYAETALGKNKVALQYATYSSYPTTYFRGYVVTKVGAGVPKVVFTIDGWNTVQVIDTMSDRGTKNGIKTWFFIGRDYGNVNVDFAIAYDEDGGTSWDNNFGANYRVAVGVTAP